MTRTAEYKAGYDAGRRYSREPHEAKMARMALAAAIASGIMVSPWRRKQPDGSYKTLNDAEGIASTVADVVNSIERKL